MDINNLPVKFEKYQPPETEIDYSQSAIPKKYREKKKPKGLRTKRPAKKSQIDMTVLEIPKVVRVDNPEAKNEVKKPICEVCGKPAYGDPHHVESVGSGGPDIKENQIQLCWDCHYVKVPAGKLPKPVLFLIIAKRERVDVVDLIEGVKSQCV